MPSFISTNSNVKSCACRLNGRCSKPASITTKASYKLLAKFQEDSLNFISNSVDYSSMPDQNTKIKIMFCSEHAWLAKIINITQKKI